VSYQQAFYFLVLSDWTACASPGSRIASRILSYNQTRILEKPATFLGEIVSVGVFIVSAPLFYLVIAKAVHGQLAAGVSRAAIVRQVALFGAQNRDGWGVGLTILTALGKRTLAAKNMREMVDDLLRERSRFASQDLEDAKLRTRFFELLGRTPTFRLIRHLQDAVHAGDFACKESIRFEFQCRDDRDEYTKSFEKVLAKNALHDPVEMRKRLANICIAAEKTDARITEFLTRTRCMRTSRGLLGVAEKHQMHHLRKQKSSTVLNAQESV
jgi:hypothetical protein